MNTPTGFTIDINIIYLVLVFGLWAVVTAAYIPGTGIPEGLALVSVGAAVLILFNLPTNWVAALLIALGVLSFLLIPFLNARLARLAQAGLILQVIGGLFLFRDGPQVSWLVIAVTIGIELVYHNFALLPLLERARRQSAVRDDNGQLIGTYGRVVRPFSAVGKGYTGTVNVRGEQWTANSSQALQTGEDIVVVERDGLQLFVEAVKHKQMPPTETEEL